jgi:hypothetical protein
MVNKIFDFFSFLTPTKPSRIGSRTATMLRLSTLNTRIGGSCAFRNPLRTTNLTTGHEQPWRTPSRHLLRLQPITVTTTNAFSTSARCTAAIEKKALNKKITLPKDPYLLSEKVVKFSKNGKLDDAITLVMESPKSRQNEVVWNHLIQESSKLGKINQSWQLLNDVKVLPSVNSLIVLFLFYCLFERTWETGAKAFFFPTKCLLI